jgi:hypothetical protein
MTLNQVKFDEHEFPFCKQNFCQTIPLIYIKSALDVKWKVHNKLHVENYSKVHHDKVSNVIVLQVNCQENTFTRVLMHKWVLDKLELEQVYN